MLAWTQLRALDSTYNNISSKTVTSQKRLFLDEGEDVLPESKRRKQAGNEAQQKEASAVMEQDLPLIIERSDSELEEKEEKNVVRCDEDVSMCRDLAHYPKIQVHVQLERFASLPMLDHRLRPSSSFLALVPYTGKLPDTLPREGEKNELNKEVDLMMTD